MKNYYTVNMVILLWEIFAFVSPRPYVSLQFRIICPNTYVMVLFRHRELFAINANGEKHEVSMFIVINNVTRYISMLCRCEIIANKFLM